MKTNKTIGIMATLMLCFVMWACGGADKAAQVASKIANGEQLTQEDYTEMVDYCGKYAREAQKLQDEINLLSPTSVEAGKLTEQVAALSDKYSYANEFFSKISNSTKEEVGAANVAKIEELAPLTWFSAPEWADVAQDSDVAGSIVDMPEKDTVGVIAVGAGEMVDSVSAK